MASCSYCKITPAEKLKSCVCRKAFYCGVECQKKDWKTNKPSCPPYVVGETPGKGRGLFATRKIKEDYPLFTLLGGISFQEFQANHYPSTDDETKAKIL